MQNVTRAFGGNRKRLEIFREANRLNSVSPLNCLRRDRPPPPRIYYRANGIVLCPRNARQVKLQPLTIKGRNFLLDPFRVRQSQVQGENGTQEILEIKLRQNLNRYLNNSIPCPPEPKRIA